MMTTSVLPDHPHHHQQHNAKKKCSSVSCSSPLRVWRTVQTIISAPSDAKAEFERLIQTTEAHILVPVLLGSRASNDPCALPPSQKARVVQFPSIVRQEAVRKFGKSATDLNALQLALIQGRKELACMILTYLNKQRDANASELRVFVNHVWGQRNTTLHLACFWNMPRLVRLLLDLGADPAIRNAKQLSPLDCCTNESLVTLLMNHTACTTTSTSAITAVEHVEHESRRPVDQRRLSQRQAQQQQPEPMQSKPTSQQQPIMMARPSMLLRKAAERQYFSPPSPPAAMFVEPIEDKQREMKHVRMSPMSFSSSSSSSSFSSASSTEDHCWTPPPSPMATPPHPSSFAQHYEEEEEEEDEQAPQDPSKRVSSSPLAIDRPGCIPARRQVRFDTVHVLADACTRGDIDEVKMMGDIIRHGTGGVQNRSLLHLALMHGHVHLAKFLIPRVDVNHPDNDGWTALHYAAALGLWSLLDQIAARKETDIGAQTNNGLFVFDCPETEADRRRCRVVIERVLRRSKNASSTAVHHPAQAVGAMTRSRHL
ncbi:ankyrin repeat-containing domain protein [Syncephalastrum racemosum]|uniref:Ankyrin repeat-containing domain protein n=1 Tax=Syncephalastrum racemosum TaxID=13706 RepID=A0A1X2HU07_SYNRA|nr:ankyrin repeat-containing domain protein [Syncephalastrum racemosum]